MISPYTKGFSIYIGHESGGGSGAWFETMDKVFEFIEEHWNEKSRNIHIKPKEYKDRMDGDVIVKC